MSAFQYIDSHAHLPMLTHSPLEEILERAREAGISKMITVSTDESNWESNRAIALSHPHLYYTLGLHPHDGTRWTECAANLLAYFPGGKVPEKCVAIGEMGLDYHYDFSPREFQITAFESQLELAKRVDLPVVVHCRNAFADLFASIKKVGTSSRGGVMHCFTGTLEEAKQSLDLGFKISFSGILTFKTAAQLRETAKSLPLTALMLETDCPYLAPIPNRGKPNEPSFLPLTALQLASTRGASIEEIAHQTTQNAVEFFGLE